MILPDSSAWIAFLRRSGSPANIRIRELIASDEEIFTTEPVVMEVLAGARDGAHYNRLRQLMRELDLLPVGGLDDYEDAAALYSRCRQGGVTVRRHVDCLIAVVAIRRGAIVLHEDHDFEQLARFSNLQTAVK